MRVWHVTDAYLPQLGGVERMIQGLTRAQRDLGWETRVFSRALPGVASRESIDGTEVVRVPFRSRPTPLAYLSTINGFARELKADCNKRGMPDVLHAHLTLSGLGAVRAAADLNLPLIATFYGPWHAESRAESLELRQRGPAYRLYLAALQRAQRGLQLRLLKRARVRIVLSEYSARCLAADFQGLSAQRVPGGVDLERFKLVDRLEARRSLGWPEQGHVLISVRRLARRMGLDRLLRALALLDQPDLKLVIGGAGAQGDELRGLARELGLSERVRFTGALSERELPLALAAADLFVLPSKEQEHFGLVILESIACGTPVVGAAMCAIPETLSRFDAGLIAAGPEPAQLAAGIDAALLRIQQLAAACHGPWRQILEQHYSFAAVARATAEVYSAAGARVSG